MSETEFSDDDPLSLPGCLARPPAGRGPLVFLLPAWWGLNDFFRQFCTKLAGEGFVTFGLDYYDGQVAITIEDAEQLRSSLDRKQAKKNIKKTVEALRSQGWIQGERIGVIGFSLGAGLAAELARTYPAEVAAVVFFYGVPGGKFAKVEAAFQGHFAEQDAWGGNPERVQALGERLGSAGLQYAFYTYPDTQHWFFEEDRPEAFNPDAAELAWQRIVQFLKSKLHS